MSSDLDRGAIAFAERLMTLLAEGRFTATYKYSVLLALMDLCLESSTKSGSPPESVTTHQLAEKVLELYWPHTVPYFDSSILLKQNSGGQASILSKILRFRSRHAPDAGVSLARARFGAGKAYERLVRSVEWTLIKMPLPRLQTVGNEEEEFLYHIRWTRDITQAQVRSPEFDNLIRFVGNAAEHLTRLSGLLRPLIEREWTLLVARFNESVLPNMGLHRFLFGSDRLDLTPVRAPLRALAGGRCFYCDERVRGAAEVDHFIPWSRYPDNGIENLVIADKRCNNSKRDHLAARPHVERWLQRLRGNGRDLEVIALDAQWEHHSERSESVARSMYLRLHSNTKLWNAPGRFDAVNPGEFRRVFA